jgi:protein ImuB
VARPVSTKLGSKRLVSKRPAATKQAPIKQVWACIDLKAFPLQLLLRREPSWRELPAAVVAEDKPNAKILWLNERARAEGILPGMRYSAGLGLRADLCAGVVEPDEIERATNAIVERLRRFGPDVEAAVDEKGNREPGILWISGEGLQRIQRSQTRWAHAMERALAKWNLQAGIVVGTSRFNTYALVRALKEPLVWVQPDAGQEHASARRVPLDRLAFEPKVRDALYALGITTLGQLLNLPADGLRDRFGNEVYRLHRLARGEDRMPIQPEAEVIPLRESMLLDNEERDIPRLMFICKRLIDPLLARLSENRQALASLNLELCLERGPGLVERLAPADPTLNARQILDLLLLRLESLKLKAGVTEVAIQAEAVSATQKQLDLFAAQPKRDPAAIKRAFARLRAEYGDDAVTFARLREGHMPEACYEWLPLYELPAKPKPRLCRRSLIRRLRVRPWALPHRPRHEEDGWQLRGRDDASVQSLLGPYVVSGGWWRVSPHGRQAQELRRDYYFAGTQKGEWLWVYRDRVKRRWFLHGRVE